MNVAIDVETTMKPRFLPWIPDSYLVCVSTYSSDNKSKTWFFNHNAISCNSTAETIEEINNYLSGFKRVIAHNMKFDLQWLDYIGIDTSNHKLYCTMVSEYLIRGQLKQEGLTLDQLGIDYDIPAKKDKVKIYWDAGIDTPDIPVDILQTYCEQDAVNAMAIFRRQVKKLKELNLTTLFALEMEALCCFAEMERNGMRLDVEKLEEHQVDFGYKLEVMDAELKGLLGIPNIDSGDQLSVALFGGEYTIDGTEEVNRILKSGKAKTYTRNCKVSVPMDGLGFNPEKLGIAETKKVGIYETNVVALSKLKAKTTEQKRCVELLFERSRLAQMKSTYFDGLLKILIGEYAHPTINQALTKTGRTSCARPNLQNQPRGNTGPVKECFITRF